MKVRFDKVEYIPLIPESEQSVKAKRRMTRVKGEVELHKEIVEELEAQGVPLVRIGGGGSFFNRVEQSEEAKEVLEKKISEAQGHTEEVDD